MPDRLLPDTDYPVKPTDLYKQPYLCHTLPYCQGLHFQVPLQSHHIMSLHFSKKAIHVRHIPFLHAPLLPHALRPAYLLPVLLF